LERSPLGICLGNFFVICRGHKLTRGSLPLAGGPWSPPPADELINKDKDDVVNWQHHDDAKRGVGAVAAATRSSPNTCARATARAQRLFDGEQRHVNRTQRGRKKQYVGLVRAVPDAVRGVC
jgi:hypothetical protein